MLDTRKQTALCNTVASQLVSHDHSRHILHWHRAGPERGCRTDKYKARNVIERSIGRIKDFRAIATRYDTTARNFLSGICLTAVIVWWIN